MPSIRATGVVLTHAMAHLTRLCEHPLFLTAQERYKPHNTKGGILTPSITGVGKEVPAPELGQNGTGMLTCFPEPLGGQLIGFISVSLTRGWCLVNNYYIERMNENQSLVRKADT